MTKIYKSDAKIFLDDTVGKLKKKIGRIFNADKEKVIFLHKGVKLTDDDKKLSELDLFLQDNLFVIINGLCDY